MPYVLYGKLPTFFENNVDLDQLVSDEASWSGSTLLSLTPYSYLYYRYGVDESLAIIKKVPLDLLENYQNLIKLVNVLLFWTL